MLPHLDTEHQVPKRNRTAEREHGRCLYALSKCYPFGGLFNSPLSHAVRQSDHVLGSYQSHDSRPDTTMTDNTIPVVVEPEAKEEAYRMGYKRFHERPDGEDRDEYWFSHYAESAEWADNKLPKLRAMAGAKDRGHGTYTEHRDIVVVQEPDDRPMVGIEWNSSRLFEELVDQFRNGAHDKVEGNEYGDSMEL